MRILVFIKQVPAPDSVLRIGPDGKHLDESALTFQMNGPDAYALEAALQLKERWHCEVVVLCAGPERVTKTLREAMARGAERGVHVLTPEEEERDPFRIASVLATAAKSEEADLLLTGLQSEDNCSGQTAVIMAELLGYAHATLVTEVEVLQGRVRVRKELEDGWSQYVTLPMPSVLSIQSGQSKPRLASMVGIRQAKSKEIKVLRTADLEANPSVDQRIMRLERPVRQNQVQVFTGEARECARALVEKLRVEARVL